MIEPNIDAVRKRQAYLVTDFGKQLGRDSLDNKDLLLKDEYYIAVGTEEEKLERPDRRVAPATDFGKGPDRFPEALKSELVELDAFDRLNLDPEIPKPKVKGSVRFQENPPRFPKAKENPPNETEQRIQTHKALDKLKPHAPAVVLSKAGYVDLETQAKRKAAQKAEADKYQEQLKEKQKADQALAKKLQDRSRGVVTKTVPRKAPSKTKKKSEREVDAEIARYMKELGLE